MPFCNKTDHCWMGYTNPIPEYQKCICGAMTWGELQRFYDLEQRINASITKVKVEMMKLLHRNIRKVKRPKCGLKSRNLR